MLQMAVSHGNRKFSGRPRANNSIKFSPQPKSIVSQLLKKMITEKKVTIPIEQSSNFVHNEGEDYFTIVEDPDPNNDINIQELKKTCENSKNETKPKSYYCDYCYCTYSTKLSSNLQKHKRIHTGEKPYLCDRCSFRTNFSNSLKVHRRLHTEERPYCCSHCHYKCNSISNLKKHCQTKHKDQMTP